MGEHYETLREPWTYERNPTYGAAQDWAVGRLGPPAGRLLVVGSPPAEVLAFHRAGWDVTWVDCRRPPKLIGVTCVQVDACELPDDWTGRFDAVSTTCVWCHVGMGRYGDRIQANAPVLFLAELRRVCPGGQLVAMVGPVAQRSEERPAHRVSTLFEVQVLLTLTDWSLHAQRVWNEDTERWVNESDIREHATEPPAEYLVVAAR